MNYIFKKQKPSANTLFDNGNQQNDKKFRVRALLKGKYYSIFREERINQ